MPWFYELIKSSPLVILGCLALLKLAAKNCLLEKVKKANTETINEASDLQKKLKKQTKEVDDCNFKFIDPEIVEFLKEGASDKTQINVLNFPRFWKTDFSLSGVIDSPFGDNKDKFVLETRGIHSFNFWK